jgi:DnaJ-class molecular chaperone
MSITITGITTTATLPGVRIVKDIVTIKKMMKMNKVIDCPLCHGSGKNREERWSEINNRIRLKLVECSSCGGKGLIELNIKDNGGLNE